MTTGLAATGLKATQLTLLSQVELMNEPTLKELANELVMDLSALSHTWKPLARDGLITIVPDKRDARAKRVTLTAGGRAKLEIGFRLWTDVHRRFEEVLGREQAEKLRATLDMIASRISQRHSASFRPSRRHQSNHLDWRTIRSQSSIGTMSWLAHCQCEYWRPDDHAQVC